MPLLFFKALLIYCFINLVLGYYFRDTIILFFQCCYNSIIWRIVCFCINHDIAIVKALGIWQREVAYIRNEHFNPQICAISLKKFDKSFEEILLHCGHKFDKECLNQYEYHVRQNPPFKGYSCPICKETYSYLLEGGAYVYDYDFYRNQSVLYDKPLFL